MLRGPPDRMREPRPHPRSQNDPELKVAGRNACRALFAARPSDIRRVYVTEETLPHFKDVLKYCAQQRIAYHVTGKDDLTQITDSVHHDGVCFIAREKPPIDGQDVLRWAQALPRNVPGRVVLLEDVKNPHNVGAILRVCAHFGVPFCLAAGQTPALSQATMRTAEGGAEHCALAAVGAGHEVLDELRALGFAVVATSSHATLDLGKAPLPPRVVVLFGSEGEGLSRDLLARADATVAIPGSGALESLNVACASSVILWELWRGTPASRDAVASTLTVAPRNQRPGPREKGPPFVTPRGRPHARGTKHKPRR